MSETQETQQTHQAEAGASGVRGMRPVALDAIESELDNMWRDANARVAATGGHAIARNSVLTLVAFTHGEDNARHLLRRIHALSTQHPSRAIIVAADPQDRGHDMRAYISTYTSTDLASYGEDIVVVAQSEAIRHLPGLVLPLIVSGLPAFLWWTGEPPWGSELLEALVDGSDRLIMDTTEMPHTAQSVGALDDLMRRKAGRCAVSDISWTAQTPWREVIAQFFDAPAARPYLDSIERVTIEYAAGEEDAPTNSSQAYLFAGWLASRLGWRAAASQPSGVGANREHALRDGGGRPVNLEISARYGVPQRIWWQTDEAGSEVDTTAEADVTPQNGHAQSSAQPAAAWVRPGALMLVHLTARLNGTRATFALAREQDLAHATTLGQIPHAATPSQTIHLQSLGERSPLAAQLQELGHDSVFEEALDAAAQLMGAGPRRGGR